MIMQLKVQKLENLVRKKARHNMKNPNISMNQNQKVKKISTMTMMKIETVSKWALFKEQRWRA
jgi:hypothetical protein